MILEFNLEGKRVRGMYIGKFPVEGIVELSRVRYGGTIEHTVVLDQPIVAFGAVRERVLLEAEFVTELVSTN